eukprot:7146345-Ditylum_brightwellii.AAC.1
MHPKCTATTLTTTSSLGLTHARRTKRRRHLQRPSQCYIRGSSVKYLRLPEDSIDKVPEDDGTRHFVRRGGNGGRGGEY